jgi:hypothetical protein
MCRADPMPMGAGPMGEYFRRAASAMARSHRRHLLAAGTRLHGSQKFPTVTDKKNGAESEDDDFTAPSPPRRRLRRPPGRLGGIPLGHRRGDSWTLAGGGGGHTMPRLTPVRGRAGPESGASGRTRSQPELDFGRRANGGTIKSRRGLWPSILPAARRGPKV